MPTYFLQIVDENVTQEVIVYVEELLKLFPGLKPIITHPDFTYLEFAWKHRKVRITENKIRVKIKPMPGQAKG